jgi:uncharacterized membrane protein (DUF485 family)
MIIKNISYIFIHFSNWSSFDVCLDELITNFREFGILSNLIFLNQQFQLIKLLSFSNVFCFDNVIENLIGNIFE